MNQSHDAHHLLDDVSTLPTEWGLVLLDRALREGSCSQGHMVSASARFWPSVRWLVAIADGRSAATEHSILRYAWYLAGLPTPSVGRRFSTPEGTMAMACVSDYHRFAATTGGTATQSAWLADRRWCVLRLDPAQIRSAPVEGLIEHIRAEHLHHLATVGLDARDQESA